MSKSKDKQIESAMSEHRLWPETHRGTHSVWQDMNKSKYEQMSRSKLCISEAGKPNVKVDAFTRFTDSFRSLLFSYRQFQRVKNTVNVLLETGKHGESTLPKGEFEKRNLWFWGDFVSGIIADTVHWPVADRSHGTIKKRCGVTDIRDNSELAPEKGVWLATKTAPGNSTNKPYFFLATKFFKDICTYR